MCIHAEARGWPAEIGSPVSLCGSHVPNPGSQAVSKHRCRLHECTCSGRRSHTKATSLFICACVCLCGFMSDTCMHRRTLDCLEPQLQAVVKKAHGHRESNCCPTCKSSSVCSLQSCASHITQMKWYSQ